MSSTNNHAIATAAFDAMTPEQRQEAYNYWKRREDAKARTVHIRDDDEDSLPDLDFDAPSKPRELPLRAVYSDSESDGNRRGLKRPRKGTAHNDDTQPTFSIFSDSGFSMSSQGMVSSSTSSSIPSLGSSSPVPSSPPAPSASRPTSSERRTPLPQPKKTYETEATPMVSNAKKIKSGQYQTQNVLAAVEKMLEKEPDYLLHLWHNGYAQKGHPNCDPLIVDAIANCEAKNPQYIQPYGRLFPPEDFWFCHGAQLGRTLAEADHSYVLSQSKNLDVLQKRPWFAEAVELARAQGRLMRPLTLKKNAHKHMPFRKYQAFKRGKGQKTLEFKKDGDRRDSPKKDGGEVQTVPKETNVDSQETVKDGHDNIVVEKEASDPELTLPPARK